METSKKPEYFVITSENAKLVEAIVEDLTKIGYESPSTTVTQSQRLGLNCTNCGLNEVNLNDFKKLKYWDMTASVKTFVLPQQYQEVLDFAKTQLELPYWKEKKCNFKTGEWICSEVDNCITLARFEKLGDLGTVEVKEYYQIAYEKFYEKQYSLFDQPVYLFLGNFKKATNNQIIDVLARVARNKGYLKGIKFKDLVNNAIFTVDAEVFDIFGKEDRLYIRVKENSLSNKTASIYKDYNWAEIITGVTLKFGDIEFTINKGSDYAETKFGKITKEEIQNAINWLDAFPFILKHPVTIHDLGGYKTINNDSVIIGFGCQKGKVGELREILKELNKSIEVKKESEESLIYKPLIDLKIDAIAREQY